MGNSTPDLQKVIRFVGLLNAFRRIERTLFVNDEERRENDVEHSYMLAMTGWYIASLNDLHLDRDLMLQYALVHDLVEVYAGDTPFYSDQKVYENKKIRETGAAHRLSNEFPEFNELHTLIEQYEKREDNESKFVYALDKILPVITIYLDKGRSWKADGVTLEMLLTYKRSKVRESSCIQDYFDLLVEILKKEERELFNEITSHNLHNEEE